VGHGGERVDDLTFFSSACKCLASDVAISVTTDAVQLLGGHGYVNDYPVERMMCDAKITQIYEGTNQIQRMVIARQLLRSLSNCHLRRSDGVSAVGSSQKTPHVLFAGVYDPAAAEAAGDTARAAPRPVHVAAVPALAGRDDAGMRFLPC
jgi:hypothetical protein